MYQVQYKKENQVQHLPYNQGNKAAILKGGNEIPFFVFPEFLALSFLKHGFSTRLGGVSKAHLQSLNLSFSRGDNEENVKENYRLILNAIGIENKNLVFSDQVHQSRVHKVTKEDISIDLSEKKLKEIDGLITNIPGIVLVTSYADCVPLFFADPVQKVIGLAHAGWRGTAAKIGLCMVKKMQEDYQCKPENIIAAIGPSICRDCYEVSQEVIEVFKENFSDIIIERITQAKGNNKYQLDLWLANKEILLEAGLKEKNITISEVCTCCNSTLLFSHRASKGMRGNLAAFLTINLE